jgi:Emfourin
MRVELVVRSTGLAYFPGLARPVAVDTRDLPAERVRELIRLVEEARFFQLPAELDPGLPGAADRRICTLTVERGVERHSVTLADPVEVPALQALVQFVRVHGRP